MADIITVSPVRDFYIEVDRGNVLGMTDINKFGRNTEVDASAVADIWDGGFTVASGGVSLIWVAPTQARIHEIVSSDAGDTDGGAGARTVMIHGMKDWDSRESMEFVKLKGTTAVDTANPYVIIFRMMITEKGATDINIGTIKATAKTDGTITAQILPSAGQTQMAIMGIPSTVTAYMDKFYANMNKKGGQAAAVDVSLLVNTTPKEELTNFATRHTFGLMSVGTSLAEIDYKSPKVIPGPAIIKVQVESGTNDVDVSAGFDMVLIDN